MTRKKRRTCCNFLIRRMTSVRSLSLIEFLGRPASFSFISSIGPMASRPEGVLSSKTRLAAHRDLLLFSTSRPVARSIPNDEVVGLVAEREEVVVPVRERISRLRRCRESPREVMVSFLGLWRDGRGESKKSS